MNIYYEIVEYYTMVHLTISATNEILQIYSLTKDLGDNEILHSQSDHLIWFFNRLDYLAALDIDDKYVQKMIGSMEKKYILKSLGTVTK